MFRRAAKTVAARAGLIAANIVYIPLLANLLGAERYGVMSLALSTAMAFVGVSLAGSNWRLSVQIGSGVDRQEEMVGRFLAVRCVTAVFAMALCLGWGYVRHGELFGIFALFSLLLLPRSLSALYMAVLIGRGRADLSIGTELAGRIAEIILVVVGITIFSFGIYWIAIAAMINWAGQFAFLRRQVGSVELPQHLGKATISVLKESWPYAVLGSAVLWLGQSAMTMAPSDLEPRDALGWIGLAVNVVTPALALLTSFLAILTPQMAQSAKNRTAFAPKVYVGGLVVACISGLACYILVSFSGDWLIRTFLSPDYLAFVELALPLSILVSTLSALTICSSIIGYYERVGTAGFAVCAGIAAVFIATAAFEGAMTATSVIYATTIGASVAVILLTGLFFRLHFSSRTA